MSKTSKNKEAFTSQNGMGAHLHYFWKLPEVVQNIDLKHAEITEFLFQDNSVHFFHCLLPAFWYLSSTFVADSRIPMLAPSTGLSLALVHSSTNMLKSVWTSGLRKPLVHTNRFRFLWSKFFLPRFHPHNHFPMKFHLKSLNISDFRINSSWYRYTIIFNIW